MKNRKMTFTTKFIVRAGIFSALATLFYALTIITPPIFGDFLKLHIDEVPIFIASFAYGPIMGIIVIVVKTLLAFIWDANWIGLLADFVCSFFFVIPAAFLYKKNRRFKTVILGFGLGFLFEIIVSFVFNIFVTIPFYFGKSFDSEILLLGVSAILPFNAIKNALVIALTIPTYKSLHRLIDKIQ